ncbi:multi-sensor hybrid histidine kinase [Stanieria sp. NIES-3757]|nr:multi-sensor hybrid histidine kinase [Stanieria sp. NIES-3757]
MVEIPRTILIVDDAPEDRKLYRRYLLKNCEYSYTILEADLGQQGLELWQQQQPDLVLLDARLPDLDGLAFLAQLRSLVQQTYLPVIMVTGQEHEAIASQAIKAGAQDYLIKEQITPERLSVSIERVIEIVQLRTKLQQRSERERLIAQINRKIHQTLNLEEILQTTVTEVRQFLQSDRVLIFRLQSNGWGEVVTESVAVQWTPLLYTSLSDPCFNENDLESFRQGLVTITSDLHDGSIPPCQVELLTKLQVRANLVVPILVRERLWGMLIVHYCAAPHQWQPLEIELLQELAIQLGIALQQSKPEQQAQNELAERRRIELELRESEERLRSSLKASRMGTWDWNIKTGLIQWSENLETFFGLKHGEFEGTFKMFVDLIHPNDRDHVLATIDHAIATGEDYDIEFRTVSPNGIVRWALSQGKVFYNQAGQPVRMAGNHIDITERQQAAEILRESEERFRQLAENINTVFWIREAFEERVSYVSPAYKRLWGLDPQELYESQQAWVQYIHPDDREAIAIAFREKATTGKFDEEYRIILPDGNIRWIRDRCFPIEDQKGNIYRFTGIAEDLTDAKQRETELRQTEIVLKQTTERLNVALKSAPITLFNQDLELRYTWIYNPTNYRVEDVVGKRDEELASPDTAARLTLLKQQVLETGIGLREEVKVTIKGQTNYYDLTIDPIRDRQNAINGITCAAVDITNLKQSEEALRLSEAEFRIIANASPALIWVCSATGANIYFNERWYEYTGQSLEEPLGFGWVNTIHSDDAKRILPYWQHCCATGEPYEGEVRYRQKDGEYRWHRFRALPQRNNSGAIEKWFGCSVDIHDGKRAEEVIAANEARLRGFVEANVVGILYGDIYGNIYEANDELLKIVGYTREELRAGRLRWIDITPPEHLPLDEQAIAEAQAKGACTPYEKEYIHKDGRKIPILVGYSLVGEAREESVAFILDLSDRKAAEAALKESEERFRQMAETISDIFWMMDVKQKQILYINPAFERIWGRSPEQLYQRLEAGYAYIHPEDRERVVFTLDQALETNGFEIEYRIIRPDGSIRYLHERGFVVPNEQGQLTRLVGVAQDITYRKHAEHEREQLLQREQLARQEAERANRIKDEFLAILSHELRSPLNPILGWAQLLQMSRLNSDQMAEGLATIERNAKLQTQLIDDLLDVAKILRGKLSMKMASVNLAFVIEAAIGTVRTAAMAKSIQLQVELPQVGQIFGDAARLQQIIWNLLSNAIKFTPNHGRVDIQLSLLANQSSTIQVKYAEIIIRDTGKGIKPDFLPYIFESFRQEDASTTRNYGGLGLGLAIVRYLVEAHGGTIWADSKGEGQGATFTVRLPLLVSQPTSHQSEQVLKQELDLTGIRILTVDDEPDARKLLTVLLTQYGAEVLSVASAGEVLANLESFQPDVLVSDIGMPNVNGYSLIEQIRDLSPQQGGQVPAIALTAYAREEDRQQAFTSGYQWHINKPLEPEQLVQAVMSLVPHQDR